MAEEKSRGRRGGPPNRARVARTEQLSTGMVRVVFAGEDVAGLPELVHTDHYIKIVFGQATRTYTIRSLDRERGEMTVDFVVHGDAGLAGLWAAAAAPGDEIEFRGPGGAWAPDADAVLHLLVGDESAAPAIAAALDRLPAGAAAEVYVEVEGPGAELPLPTTTGTTVHWIHRDGRHPGVALADAVQRSEWDPDGLCAFVHGNADMIKDLRRFLFLDRGVPRSQVSISGYWRTGLTEDDWQASKREFMARVEAEEAAAVTD